MKLMGHRGARREFAENTLRSIEIALAAGVGAVEIDVRLSRDGHLIVIHDETLDRTTNGEGAVLDMNIAELRALDAGEGERLPTLDEVLELVRGRAELFVELKAADCEEVTLQYQYQVLLPHMYRYLLRYIGCYSCKQCYTLERTCNKMYVYISIQSHSLQLDGTFLTCQAVNFTSFSRRAL